ncbi:facilitated trehalose transporter Tret1-like, partial [Copidosoma floridanum]|uniref:facilitated trehalose transporter Tret1-like n=1 Tax=Copidosoma floridanum TaxID=29053 RepID=UPI0006C98CA1
EFLPNSSDESTRCQLTLRNFFPQIFFGCTVHLIVIQAGINMAYGTILHDGLKKDFFLSVDEISWIASLVTISLPLGSIIAGPLMDMYGRKKICIASCIPSLLSWIILIRAPSLDLIYTARIVSGISGGLSTVGLVYISEIAHPQIRPMLLCFNSIFVSFGILITYCFGVWLTWKQMAIFFMILNIFIIFLLLFIPESPYWIMCFNNIDLNEKLNILENVLRRLNKSKDMYEQEYKRIIEATRSHKRNYKGNNNLSAKCLNFFKQLLLPTVYKPTLILFILFLLQQLTGIYIIVFYALSVFESMEKLGKINKYGAVVILGFIRFFMSIITSFCSKKFGRRALCLASTLGMAISMFFSAMYVFLISFYNKNEIVTEVIAKQKWFPLINVFFYMCSSCFGFVIIPWTLIGEILPIFVRGIISGAMVSIAYLMMFGMIKGFPYLEIRLGMHNLFLFFSITSFISAAFVYIFVPETLGKSFLDIEKHFKNSQRSKMPSVTADS